MEWISETKKEEGKMRGPTLVLICIAFLCAAIHFGMGAWMLGFINLTIASLGLSIIEVE